MGWHCQNCKRWIVDDKFRTCTYCSAPRGSFSTAGSSYGDDVYYRTNEQVSKENRVIRIIIILFVIALVYLFWKPIVQTLGIVIQGQLIISVGIH